MMNTEQEKTDYEQDAQKTQQSLFQPASPPDSGIERWLLAASWAALGAVLLYIGLPFVLMTLNITTTGEVLPALAWRQRVMTGIGGALLWLSALWFFRHALSKLKR